MIKRKEEVWKEEELALYTSLHPRLNDYMRDAHFSLLPGITVAELGQR